MHVKGVIITFQELEALDHDIHSSSLTPSVFLDVDLPEDVNDSFVQGHVSVTLKDSVFQGSTAFRYVLLKKSPINSSLRVQGLEVRP